MSTPRTIARQVRGLLLTAGLAALAVSSARAASVLLDPSFGQGGKVVTDFGSSSSTAYGAAVQQNGKIVVAGTAGTDSGSDFALARYNPNGSLDATFGEGGVVTTDFANGYDSATSVIIQPDGQILVGGVSDDGDHYCFALARYNTDGTLDTTFGPNADGRVVSFEDQFGDYQVQGLAVQPDGQLVAAGWSSEALFTSMAVARYNPDGSPDSSFGEGGTEVLAPSDSNSTLAAGVAVTNLGQIVLAGFIAQPNIPAGNGADFALTRLLADGSVDPTFGTEGWAVTDFLAGTDAAQGLAFQADGSIIAAGYSGHAGDYDFALARYSPDGVLDPSFGANGLVTTSFGSPSDFATCVVVQLNDQIVLAGTASPRTVPDFALARYNAQGDPDTQFGVNGQLLTDFSGGDDRAFGLAIPAGGGVVAVGGTLHQPGTQGAGRTDFALARYVKSGKNTAPTVRAGGNVSVDEGAEFTQEGFFLDPDEDDTWTATVNYGDGTGVQSLDVEQSTHAFTLDHIYTDNGYYTVTVVVTDNHGGFGSGVFHASVKNVAPVVTISADEVAVQYSDRITPVLVSATDMPGERLKPTAASKLFGPTAYTNGLPEGLVLDSLDAQTWRVRGKAQVAPGIYQVRVTITDKDGGYSRVEFTLTVSQEDARVHYNGPTSVRIPASAGGKATIKLHAQVFDISALPNDPATDTFAGNISKATLSWVNRDTGEVIHTMRVPLKSGQTKIGVPAYNWKVSLGGQSSRTFHVGLVVGRYYLRDSADDDATITVTRGGR